MYYVRSEYQQIIALNKMEARFYILNFHLRKTFQGTQSFHIAKSWRATYNLERVTPNHTLMHNSSASAFLFIL